MTGSHFALATNLSWQDYADQHSPAAPVPCMIRAEYADGYSGEAIGHALAWSERAAQVLFHHPDESLTARPQYRTWVPLGWLRRLRPEDGEAPPLYPHTRAAGPVPPEDELPVQ